MVTMAFAQAFSPALLCSQIMGQVKPFLPAFLLLARDVTENWVILTSFLSDLTSSHRN